MPLPNEAVFNPVLTALFKKYVFKKTDYIGTRIAPIFLAALASATYPVFDVKFFTSAPALKPRQPGDKFQRSQIPLSDDRYNCTNYGHETVVPDEKRQTYASFFDADAAAIEKNAQTILQSHEIRVNALLTGPSVTNVSTPTTLWDNYTASDPVADVKTAIRAVELQGGLTPNTLTLGKHVADVLTLHPKIRAIFPFYNGPITEEQLRIAFQVENILIAKAKKNTVNEGQGDSLGYIWGNDAFLTVSEESSNLDAPNAARTFVFGGQSGGGEAGSYVESYRDNSIASDVHSTKHMTDEKLTGPGFIYRLESVLS